jgi:hypothetical protein
MVTASSTPLRIADKRLYNAQSVMGRLVTPSQSGLCGRTVVAPAASGLPLRRPVGAWALTADWKLVHDGTVPEPIDPLP